MVMWPNNLRMGTSLQRSTFPLKAITDTVVPKTYTELLNSGLLMPVRNQGQCGSCWAFSITGALGNRISIVTKGAIKMPISVQYFISCDQDATEHGCDGTSSLDTAYDHATGDSDSSIKGIPAEKDVPYTSGDGNLAACNFGQPTLYKFKQPILTLCSTDDETMKTVDAAQLEKNIIRMKQDILESGPICAAYWVYDDLATADFTKPYKHGAGSSRVGGHAIELVGWSADAGGEYWIVRNSWGSDWGLGGYYYHYMRDGYGTDDYNGMELCGHSAMPDMTWYTGDKTGTPPAPKSLPVSPTPQPASSCPVCPPCAASQCPAPPKCPTSQCPAVKLSSPTSGTSQWVTILFAVLPLLLLVFAIIIIFAMKYFSKD